MNASTRRANIRLFLNPLYLPFYDNLCDLLPDEWAPYYGMRAMVVQDQLYAQGRTAAGHIVTNARGGESAHNYGCASDWTVFKGEEPLWLTKENPIWKTYVDAVTKVGLRPGAEFGDLDHNELRIKVSWPVIFEAYKYGGATPMDAANKAIKDNMVTPPIEVTFNA